jgi:hypothetical protein
MRSQAVGDRSIISLCRAIGENWPLIAGGFGLAMIAAKIERTKDKGVQEIADEALRRYRCPTAPFFTPREP